MWCEIGQHRNSTLVLALQLFFAQPNAFADALGWTDYWMHPAVTCRLVIKTTRGMVCCLVLHRRQRAVLANRLLQQRFGTRQCQNGQSRNVDAVADIRFSSDVGVGIRWFPKRVPTRFAKRSTRNHEQTCFRNKLLRAGAVRRDPECHRSCCGIAILVVCRKP